MHERAAASEGATRKLRFAFYQLTSRTEPWGRAGSVRKVTTSGTCKRHHHCRFALHFSLGSISHSAKGVVLRLCHTRNKTLKAMIRGGVRLYLSARDAQRQAVGMSPTSLLFHVISCAYCPTGETKLISYFSTEPPALGSAGERGGKP